MPACNAARLDDNTREECVRSPPSFWLEERCKPSGIRQTRVGWGFCLGLKQFKEIRRSVANGALCPPLKSQEYIYRRQPSPAKRLFHPFVNCTLKGDRSKDLSARGKAGPPTSNLHLAQKPVAIVHQHSTQHGAWPRRCTLVQKKTVRTNNRLTMTGHALPTVSRISVVL